MARIDGRKNNQLRSVKIKKGYQKYAHGSCLITWGNTKILCTATLEDKVPPFLRNAGRGWLTAEYSMLPSSSTSRISREGHRGKISGRTQEIQRLIGRSLRSIIDFDLLGERTIIIDCDVIQADGGTRTASITGAFIALGHLVEKCLAKKKFPKTILKHYIAGVSVGIINDLPMIDLCYEEDSNADVDMNVVMTDTGQFVEIQGTAEGAPFSMTELQSLLALAKRGIHQLILIQKQYVSL